MSKTTLDLPQSIRDSDNEVLVLSSFHNVYQPSNEHDGQVFVEKCLVRKSNYIALPLNTEKILANKRSYLVQETNFQSVNGGFTTFERHYATLPSDFFDFAEVSYRALWWGAVNYRSIVGSGASWDATRFTLAKRTHRFFLEKDLPTSPVPEGDEVGETFANDFTRVFTIAPESRLGQRWEKQTTLVGKDIAIAPDTVNVYMGNIYEFIRHTITI